MINDVTDELIMECGWINVNSNNIFKYGTKLYSSSTKAELVAIFIALLTILEKAEVKIYTDSQATIDGIMKF